MINLKRNFKIFKLIKLNLLKKKILLIKNFKLINIINCLKLMMIRQKCFEKILNQLLMSFKIEIGKIPRFYYKMDYNIKRMMDQQND